MWKIIVYDLEHWQKETYLKDAKNVILGDETGSIIFVAKEEGVKKMRELVEQANNWIMKNER